MWLWSEADDARIFDLAAKLGKPVPGSRLPIISPSMTMGVPFFVAHGFGAEILIEDLQKLLAFVSSEPTVPRQVAPRVDPVSAVLDAEGLVSPFNEGLRTNIIEQLRLQALLWCRSHQLVDGEEVKTLATRDLQWDEFTLGRTWTGYSCDLPPFYVPVVMRVGCSAAYSAGVRYPSDECGRSWLYSHCHLLDSSFASSTLVHNSCSSSSSLSRAWKLSA